MLNISLPRSFRYLKPYWFLFFFYSLISALGYLAIFSSIGILLQQVVLYVQHPANALHFQTILLYLIAVIGLTPLSGFAQYGLLKIEKQVAKQMRIDMLERIGEADEKAIGQYSQEELLNRVKVDVDDISTWYCGYYMAMWILEPLFAGLLSILYLCTIDYRIALVCISLALIALGLTQLFNTQRSQLEETLTKEKSDVLAYSQDAMQGILEVRTFHLATLFSATLQNKLKAITHHTHKHAFYYYLRSFLIFYFADGIALVLLLLVGAYLAQLHVILFANILIAIPLYDQISQAISAIGHFFNILSEHAIHEQRIFDILDLKMQHYDNEESEAITFDHVHFAYDDKEVLHDISITLKPHQAIAIVGESGSGKSTMTKLLLGLYHPSHGTITSPNHSHMAYMMQDSALLHMSLEDNVRFYQASTLPIDTALTLAYAKDSVEKSGGLSYQVKGNEAGLSGGQVQRIAFARAIYSQKPWIIMDEPTASLDEHTEADIHKTIQTIRKDKSIVVITHRLSFIQDFDRILVMKDGKIIEDGTHQQLLANQGYYAKLYTLQQHH